MGFLSPALLALGAAVAVPIILHLFQRHQGPRVLFPALRYLRRAEKESARQIKLRQLLLMLLRIAVIVLLAVAAARPFARSGGAGHEPTAVAIVLDNSMSSGAVVGDRRVLDELKDLALATLERAGPDDRFWLLRAGASWEPALPGDAATTAARVRETEPTAAAADLPAAVGHARALLAAGADGRATEIHLLSDLQATSFRARVETAAEGPPVVAWTPRADVPRNVAVVNVQVGAGIPPMTGERSTVVATVDGEAATDSVRLRLSIDRRVVSAGVAPIGSAAVLPLPGRQAGYYAGWVDTDADALRADDRRFFTLRVVPPPAVAVVGASNFVEDALTVMAAAGRVRQTGVAEADVAILVAGTSLESVPDGRTAIVLPPESPLELPAINRRLGSAAVPWRYEPGSQVGEARFQLEGTTDELMRPLERARLTQVYALRSQGNTTMDTVLLRLRDGQEWAVRGERTRGGRYILLASPLSAAATTLPTSAAMVPLLDRLVGSWAAATPLDAAHSPGDVVSLPPQASAVRPPDGGVLPAQPSEYRLGAEAGIYEVLAGDSVIAAYAVNPPADESRLERLQPRRLATALGTRTLVTANTQAGWLNDIYRSRLGHELWRIALLLALVLLALEAMLAASGRARRAADVTGSASAAASPSRSTVFSGATAGSTEHV